VDGRGLSADPRRREEDPLSRLASRSRWRQPINVARAPLLSPYADDEADIGAENTNTPPVYNAPNAGNSAPPSQAGGSEQNGLMSTPGLPAGWMLSGVSNPSTPMQPVSEGTGSSNPTGDGEMPPSVSSDAGVGGRPMGSNNLFGMRQPLLNGVTPAQDSPGRVLPVRAAPPASSSPDQSHPSNEIIVTARVGSNARNRPTPRENVLADIVRRHEGAGPDTAFGMNSQGRSRYITPEQMFHGRHLSQLTVSEVQAYQRALFAQTRRAGVAQGRGTSAVGLGQFVGASRGGGTLGAVLRHMGITQDEWDHTVFTPELQRQMLIVNCVESWTGASRHRLGQQWESLDERHISPQELNREIDRIRVASPVRP
jgi:hypothetical protein